MAELQEKGLLQDYDKSNKVYSYRFQDPTIGLLSEHLLELNQEVEIVRDNALPRHVSTELNRILNAVEVRGFDDGRAKSIAAPALDRLQMINGLNVQYFMETIARFQGGSGPQDIANGKQSYLARLDEALDRLDSEFHSALRGLHEWLVREDSRPASALLRQPDKAASARPRTSGEQFGVASATFHQP